MSIDDIMRDLKQSADEKDRRDAISDQASMTMYDMQMAKNRANARGSTGKAHARNTDPGGSGSGSSTGAHVNIKGGPRLKAFLKAEAAQESGGDYGAVGVPTKYGTALGKYQILGSNFLGPGGWDKETIGRDVTRAAYMNHPKIQERIAQGKLAQYFHQYGAIGAAKAWYAGPGNANTNSDTPQYGGPSINDYAQAVYTRMMDYLRSGR
jgi:hypothetical protein